MLYFSKQKENKEKKKIQSEIKFIVRIRIEISFPVMLRFVCCFYYYYYHYQRTSFQSSSCTYSMQNVLICSIYKFTWLSCILLFFLSWLSNNSKWPINSGANTRTIANNHVYSRCSTNDKRRTKLLLLNRSKNWSFIIQQINTFCHHSKMFNSVLRFNFSSVWRILNNIISSKNL